MIYFATVHWKLKFWIDNQLKYIEKYTQEPYRIFSFSTGINIDDFKDKFFFIEDTAIVSHWQKLDKLFDLISEEGTDNDFIIFIDGDAFPISDYIPYIKKKIEKHKLIAIRRDENGDLFPHPSFCATTIGFWKKIGGTWMKGDYKVHDHLIIRDVGGELFNKLKKFRIEWYPLLRSNKNEIHPLFFGIYDDIIYHHGAGFRNPISRSDTMKYSLLIRPFKKFKIFNKLPKLTGTMMKIIGKILVSQIFSKNQKSINKIVRSINTNEEFYTIFE